MKAFKVNSLFCWLRRTLPPPQCALCRLPSDDALPLCRSCRDTLGANVHCCRQCAQPMVASPVNGTCGSCLVKPPSYSRVHAPWLYQGSLPPLIQAWKYQRAAWLTPLLTDLWLQQPLPEPMELLVPVPLHWQRTLTRGYNQAALFAEQLHRQLMGNYPAFRKLDYQPGLLVRHRRTRPQSQLDFSQRQHNLAGVFRLRRSGDAGLLSGRTVAVVDDVLTTGATAGALARFLLELGAIEVHIWCLARTPALSSHGWIPARQIGRPGSIDAGGVY